MVKIRLRRIFLIELTMQPQGKKPTYSETKLMKSAPKETISTFTLTSYILPLTSASTSHCS